MHVLLLYQSQVHRRHDISNISIGNQELASGLPKASTYESRNLTAPSGYHVLGSTLWLSMNIVTGMWDAKNSTIRTSKGRLRRGAGAMLQGLRETSNGRLHSLLQPRTFETSHPACWPGINTVSEGRQACTVGRAFKAASGLLFYTDERIASSALAAWIYS